VLGECQALVTLGLRDNGLGEEGVGRLASVLGECKALQYIDLDCNNIGAEGAGSLQNTWGNARHWTVSI